ncbi:MAG TPA: LCP family protein [Anaerolineae bacterium]|nr:LCP family protein [Anaerolineae bacterium]
MSKEPWVPLPPPIEETISMHHYGHVEDTQPTSGATPLPAHMPLLAGQRRRRSRLFLLLPVFLLLVSLAGGLAAGGYALWQWTGTLPRTNLLILGLDRRPDQGSVVRSDTMILMTVYPAGPRIALLSIPRDLYVEIPGYGTNRINTAHFWGENELAENGPVLAVQTVAQNLGVPVHHHLRVDFNGFRAIVDAVGGIDVVVERAIVDEGYPTEDYGTIRIEIPAGPQHMDGETALRYARSRHGASDLDRAMRQQQVLTALARRLLEPKVWLRLPAVIQVVMENVETDMTAQDLLLLAPTLLRVGPDGIEQHVIGREMTEPWTTPTGGAVLLPRWEAIHPLVQDLFTP